MKVAKVLISKSMLEEILRGNAFSNQKLLNTTAPSDLKICGLAEPNGAFGTTFWIYCESETFKDIVDGEDIPEIDPFMYTVGFEESENV